MDTSMPLEAIQQNKDTVSTSRVLNGEDEVTSLRQQNVNLRVVLKQMSEELSKYKNRCTGVDTITLLLKESQRDCTKLNKEHKVLETALVHLQNRLSNHGLPSSVNIEDNEVFVPGSSKQTLDNLARENARLKSQLKNSDVGSSKKYSEEIAALTSSIERLQCENTQMASQIQEMHSTKERMVQEYEFKLETYTTKRGADTNSLSTATQTNANDDLSSSVETLSPLLSQVSQQCAQLEDQLMRQKQNMGISEEQYIELKNNYEKVVLMNHRWQSHGELKDRESQVLQGRIAEMEDRLGLVDGLEVTSRQLKQELTMVNGMLEKKDDDNGRLRKELESLRAQIAQRSRSQPQFDMSIVEILKQQIQVCTEDFNTERKDREQAVNRVKQLEKEVNRVVSENDALKTELKILKKENMLLQQENLLAKGNYRQNPQFNLPGQPTDFNARGHRGGLTPSRILGGINQISSPRPQTNILTDGSESPQTMPTRGEFASLPRPVGGDGFDRLPSMSQLEAASMPPTKASMFTPQTFMPRPQASVPTAQAYMPMSQSAMFNQQQSAMPQGPESGQRAAIPPPQNISNLQEEVNVSNWSCPKCNKQFSESQSADLLTHIDVCTD